MKAFTRVREFVDARWGRTTTIRDGIQVRVRAGYRAGVWPLKPGLYVVAEMPDDGADFGAVATVLAPLVIKTAAKAVRERLANKASDDSAAEPGRGSQLIARLRSRRTPEWVDDTDAAMIEGWRP